MARQDANAALAATSFLYGANAPYIEELHARYEADQVCIIPGTASVAGITRMDEPVGELLDRFEQAAIDEVLGAGAEPKAVRSRRLGRPDVTGPLAVVPDTKTRLPTRTARE